MIHRLGIPPKHCHSHWAALPPVTMLQGAPIRCCSCRSHSQNMQLPCQPVDPVAWARRPLAGHMSQQPVIASELDGAALQHITAAAARRAQLADALQHGLRVVIDCSHVQAPQASSSRPKQQLDWRHPRQQQQQQRQQQQQQDLQQQQQGQRQLRQQQQDLQQKRQLVTGAFIHKELRSVAKQLEMAAAINKRSAQPVALTVTSFTGTLEAFANHMGAAAWPFNRHQASLLELFSPDQLILLSPDAAEPLEQLDPAKAYVIGGIVDKTVQKNLTRDFARDQQIPAYRLPIKEHAQQLGLDLPGASTRPVLTAADVVTALLEFNRAQDWVFALQAAVPQRKRRLHRGL